MKVANCVCLFAFAILALGCVTPQADSPSQATIPVGAGPPDKSELQAPAAAAPTLWQGARYGMTVDEVRMVFPKSRDKSFMFRGRKTVGPLEDDTEIAGYHFKVEFYFTAPDDRLDRVILGCTDKLINDQGAAIARHFVELLQSQYGEGRVSEDQSTIDPKDIDRIWITKDRTLIKLSFFKEPSLGPGAYRLIITYDGKTFRGADKL
jgi:hypothetical protein